MTEVFQPAVMGEGRAATLHPFFACRSRENDTPESKEISSYRDLQLGNNTVVLDSCVQLNEQDGVVSENESEQRILDGTRNSASPSSAYDARPQIFGNTIDLDPNSSIRPTKKRRISDIESQTEQYRQPENQAKAEDASLGKDNPRPSEQDTVPQELKPFPSTESPYAAEFGLDGASDDPSKPGKILKLDGKGGFGSPPKAKESSARPNLRARNASNSLKYRSHLVTIRYGVHDGISRADIGRKINLILSGVSVELPPTNQRLKSDKSRSKPRKPTHPFFTGNTAAQKTTSASARHESPEPTSVAAAASPKKSYSTPGKLKYEAKALRLGQAPESANSSFSSLRRVAVVQGADLNPWPWNGLTRIEPENEHTEPTRKTIRTPHSERHKKYRTSADQFLQTQFSGHSLPQTGDVQGVISPERTIETGNALVKQLRDRLTIIEDPKTCHPAISDVISRAQTSLSAFDGLECESLTWNQKYAPQKASSVLQDGREALILRDWLQNSVVSEVQSASDRPSELGRSSEEGKMMKAKRKARQKRRKEDLGDFIVSSDEDESTLREISDDELSIDHKMTESGRSVVRSEIGNANKKSAQRTANMVLLSGPHGCGKSAAVYAVAKELGFEIFEINPGVRRTGRDLVDKVGDMTLNHQVRRAHSMEDTMDEKEEPELPLEPDTNQNTLTSFFSRGPSNPSTLASKTVAKPAKPKAKPEKASSAKLRQALILLEEVDVLFEQDTSFWETLAQMAQQSKRPIILTCNDEASLPVENLNLYAILRFRPANASLLADYMLSVAAAEGHLLEREPVEAFLRASNFDLRATIAGLNVACQMGIGDEKGGLSWYLPQWPHVVNDPSEGERRRVISNKTFRLPALRGSGDDIPTKYTSGSTRQHSGWLCAKHCPHDLNEIVEVKAQQLHGLPFANESLSFEVFSQIRASSLRAFSSHADNLSFCDLLDKNAEHEDNPEPTEETLRAEATTSDYTVYPRVIHTALKQRYTNLTSELSSFTQRLSQSTTFETQYAMDSTHESSTAHSYTQHSKYTYDTGISRGKRAGRGGLPKLQAAFLPLFESRGAVHTRSAFECDMSALNASSSRIAVDIAPYVRSIVSFDVALDQYRAQLSGASSTDEHGSKRKRNTRASWSALEGGQRASTRRERWLPSLDQTMVLSTGGRTWPR